MSVVEGPGMESMAWARREPWRVEGSVRGGFEEPLSSVALVWVVKLVIFKSRLFGSEP